ncbi:MAG: FkbM family methyltransferase [Paracoccaceae bacterium]
MNEHLRYEQFYRLPFGRTIPMFQLKEISPFFQKVGYNTLSNMTVFDVGANQGQWTAALLMHSGKFVSKVHMFEPLPGNQAIIEMGMTDGLYGPHKPDIVLNKIGMSHARGKATIHFEAERSALASIDNDVALMPGTSVALGMSREIELSTVDSYCEEHGIGWIDLLKIDVEGHELSVLRGAERMFRERRVAGVLYELGPHQMARREYFQDFFKFFQQFGYNNYLINQFDSPVKAPTYTSSMEEFEVVSMRMALHPKFG